MIDKEKLRELIAAPKSTSASIYKGLGFNNSSTFYYQLNKDAEAKQIFNEWRAARAARRSDNGAGEKVSARSPRRKARRAGSKRAAPPPAMLVPRTASATDCCGESSSNSSTSRSMNRSAITLMK